MVNIITTKNVNVHYGDKKAIDNAIQNCKINNIQIPFIDLNKSISSIKC